jgi:hypothetical protein
MKNQVYIYTIRERRTFCTNVLGANFDNEWMTLTEDGSLTIKGDNADGYAWDGCTPKFMVYGMVFGVLEGDLNPETDKSRTYYPTLVHDIFYQFSYHFRGPKMRAAVDSEFLRMLNEEHFPAACAYYRAVRLVSWAFWGRKCEGCRADKKPVTN